MKNNVHVQNHRNEKEDAIYYENNKHTQDDYIEEKICVNNIITNGKNSLQKEEHRSWMERYAPPGIPLASEKLYYKIAMVISTLWSMLFLIHYVQALNSLYYMERGRKVWVEDVVMKPFEELTDGAFSIFGVVLIYTIFIAAYHYFYHYQGSKMMYLMKRLPDKWELHRRCLTLPIAAFIITIFYVLVLRALYYAIYLIFTPQQYLLLR